MRQKEIERKENENEKTECLLPRKTKREKKVS